MNDRRLREIRIRGVALLCLLGLVADSGAQGTRSDYERAMKLRETTANKVFKDRVTPHWLEGNTRFWYRNDLAEGKRQYILVDAEAGSRGPAFDHDRLAAGLAKATGKELLADELAIDRLIYDESGSELAFSYDGKWWRCDLNRYEVEASPRDEPAASGLFATEAQPDHRRGDVDHVHQPDRGRYRGLLDRLGGKAATVRHRPCRGSAWPAYVCRTRLAGDGR
jgi:hypothetical protein